MSNIRAASKKPGMPTSHILLRCGQFLRHSYVGRITLLSTFFWGGGGHTWGRCGMGLFLPTTHKNNYTSTHTLRHTNISIFKKVLPSYDYRTPESSLPRLRDDAC